MKTSRGIRIRKLHIQSVPPNIERPLDYDIAEKEEVNRPLKARSFTELNSVTYVYNTFYMPVMRHMNARS